MLKALEQLHKFYITGCVVSDSLTLTIKAKSSFPWRFLPLGRFFPSLLLLSPSSCSVSLPVYFFPVTKSSLVLDKTGNTLLHHHPSKSSHEAEKVAPSQVSSSFPVLLQKHRQCSYGLLFLHFRQGGRKLEQ